MKKKNLIILFTSLFTIMISLVIIGFLFDKTELEKQNGLSNQYDVSAKDTIAYVNYENGRPQLYLFNEADSKFELIVEKDENTYIFDPSFSPDGATLAFVTTNKNKEEELMSTVHFLDLRTMEMTDLFTDESTITEIEFNPAAPSLFYLRAGTFENYSPITGKRPHDYDVFEFDWNEGKHERKTNLGQYSSLSLQVSPDGKSLYLQTLDDSSVETAEDSFNIKQRVFEIPLDRPEDMFIISDPQREVDIYSFAITPKGDEMIFQSVSNFDEGGTFEYELFSYSFDTKEEKQLTHFGDHASDPVISKNGTDIYFMLDTNFAKGDADYHLYKMSIAGDDPEEVALPIEK